MKISETYETWTEEDVEIGDTNDRGFNFQSEDYSFRELIDYIEREGFRREGNTEWLTDCEEMDYRTGETTNRGLHFDRDNEPRLRKYWEKAIAYCSK